MKLYCNIEKVTLEDGTEKWNIKEGPCELPQNANNVSNLNLLEDDLLKQFGWVPVTFESENKEIVLSEEWEILEDKVIKKTVTRDKTEEEISDETYRELVAKWDKLRLQRNEILADSDKLVMIDRWEKLTDEEKLRISNYRQSLRDLTIQNSNPDLIVFPTL
jgi:hypothetical protein